MAQKIVLKDRCTKEVLHPHTEVSCVEGLQEALDSIVSTKGEYYEN